MNSKFQISRPSRQPDHVRKRLLQAATTLLSEGSPVSIGAVADVASVSKGAVQHHFGTREQLFTALCDLFINQFNDSLELEAESAPPAMRYARLSLKTTASEDFEGWRAMLVASVVDRSIAARWSKRMELERSKDPHPSTNALLVRLATDGLWLSDLLRTYSINDETRDELAGLMSELLSKP